MGKVVVGVDGSPGAAAALRFAVEEARLRGATLHALQASERHDVAGPDESPAGSATREVEVQFEGIDTSGVDLALDVRPGDAARALLEAAKDADVLVVGSRGRGGFRGLVLGSTSQKIAHHAPCPVVVVRATGG